MKENLILRHLIIECAINRKLTTYGELIKELKLPYDLAVAQDRKAFGEVLGQISKDENAKARPLLSSLVIDSTKMLPGEGFFSMAESIGVFSDSVDGTKMSVPVQGTSFEISKDKRILFAHKEQMKCFKFWRMKKRHHEEEAALNVFLEKQGVHATV